MTFKTDLATMGWDVSTSVKLLQATVDFQGIWNLGDALRVDGHAGELTLKAMAVSMARRKAGKPDISAHFNASEFACNCLKRRGTAYADCKRIWTPRSTVRLAEWWRSVVGPVSPVRAGRCPRENAFVGGAPKSYHLTGRALDWPVYSVTVATARKRATGVGYYTYTVGGKSVQYARHTDNRPTAVTPWPYPASSRPSKVLTPRPDLAVDRPSTSVPTAPAPAPKPPALPPLPGNWFLSEDGILDYGTRRALQRMWGVPDDGKWGLSTRKRIQAWVGVEQDGNIGEITIKALQKKIGHLQTGFWNYGWDTKSDPTTKALEAYFNRAVRNNRKPF